MNDVFRATALSQLLSNLDRAYEEADDKISFLQDVYRYPVILTDTTPDALVNISGVIKDNSNEIDVVVTGEDVMFGKIICQNSRFRLIIE